MTKSKEATDARIHRPRNDRQGRPRGRRPAAEAAQHVQRPAPDAQARALERGRPELHRRPRDDRPAGRAGPWLRRRGRRTRCDAWRVAAGHPRRDHQGPHLGRLLGRPRHRAGASGRARPGVHRRHRGHPQGHPPPGRHRPGHPGHADRPRRRAGEVPVVRPRAPGELRWSAGQPRRDDARSLPPAPRRRRLRSSSQPESGPHPQRGRGPDFVVRPASPRGRPPGRERRRGPAGRRVPRCGRTGTGRRCLRSQRRSAARARTPTAARARRCR